MSKEPENSDFGWTIDTLHMHFDRQMLDLKAKLDERHQAQMKAMETAFAAAEKAVDKVRETDQKAVDKALDAAERAIEQRASTLDKEFHEHLAQVRHENHLAFVNSDKAIDKALASAKEAVTKSESRYDARFQEANHIREQLAQQASTFLPREVADAAHADLRNRIDGLTHRLDTSSGRSSGYSAVYGWAIAGVGLLVTVIILANSLISVK